MAYFLYPCRTFVVEWQGKAASSTPTTRHPNRTAEADGGGLSNRTKGKAQNKNQLRTPAAPRAWRTLHPLANHPEGKFVTPIPTRHLIVLHTSGSWHSGWGQASPLYILTRQHTPLVCSVHHDQGSVRCGPSHLRKWAPPRSTCYIWAAGRNTPHEEICEAPVNTNTIEVLGFTHR